MRTLDVGSFLQARESFPLLDTRSPSEHDQGHIPGARSFPLFSDEERAEVGTCYKQEGRRAAIKLGLRIVGPKLEGFIEAAEEFDSEAFLMHCWRGGMRSANMAWLLERYGFDVSVLDGGYKAYRRALSAFFETPLELRVLTGKTGSKKTEVLHEMARLGEQVIDLEGIAGHQGSSFGTQATSGQPTTEQFQNELFEAFRTLDPAKPIWVEDESFRIGQVNLVEALFHQKEKAPHYHIEIPYEERIRGLVEDYGQLPEEALVRATQRIRKRLGHERTEAAVQHIRNGELEEAVAIILAYYDKAYSKGIEKKEDRLQEKRTFEHADPRRIAEAFCEKEKVQ